jgi:prolyl-tRNA editing enzyme YbaK/EbsC (Cys-tRNA(Pro) deacylase)
MNNQFEYLKKSNIGYELIKMEKAVHSVKETAEYLNCNYEKIIKTLVVYDVLNPEKMSCVAIPGNAKLDFHKINNVLNYRRLKLLPVDEVFKKTGMQIGSIPPFGTGYDHYYDINILNQDYIYAGSGNPEYLIKFDPKQLKHPQNKDLFGDFCKGPAGPS